MTTIFIKNVLITQVIFILLLSNNSFPQSSLYMPLNIKKAYNNETRSYDGRPGPNYWQNRSDYKIEVSIEPETRMLSGKEEIIYYNNSPNTLGQIVINLYQDINKYGNIRMRSLRKDALSDGVNIKNIEIDGAKVKKWNQQRYGTNLILYLPESLQPGDNLTFYIEWNFIIPKGSNIRMGTYGQSTFMVAYWYPQISVYDDIDGWDKIDYTGEQEFYGDYSNYDVSIIVSNNVCVWATGVLQNPADVLTVEYYGRYKNTLESNSVVNIIKEEDLQMSNIFNQVEEDNTWEYKAENVTDFAFAMSDSYLWDGVSLEVENGRRILISAAYDPDSKDFYEVAEISRATIDMLSKDFPAVPFPYPRFTVFNGSGGMEYPMMANDGTRYSKSSTVNITSHEISHTYFPFYVGTNEKKYAWMDEGWAQVLPIKIQDSLAEGNDQVYRNVSSYLFDAGGEMEMPVMTPSNLLNYPALGTASYFRPAVAYLILQDILGEEVFKNALQEYIFRWKEKHPMPYDFFFTFNNVTGENLDWFWKLWFFERGYPDLALKEVTQTGNKVKISVERVGLLPIPIELKLIADDFSETVIHNDASIWKNGDKEITIKEDINKKIIKVELGNILIPDVNKKNDVFEIGR